MGQYITPELSQKPFGDLGSWQIAEKVLSDFFSREVQPTPDASLLRSNRLCFFQPPQDTCSAVNR